MIAILIVKCYLLCIGKEVEGDRGGRTPGELGVRGYGKWETRYDRKQDFKGGVKQEKLNTSRTKGRKPGITGTGRRKFRAPYPSPLQKGPCCFNLDIHVKYYIS